MIGKRRTITTAVLLSIGLSACGGGGGGGGGGTTTPASPVLSLGASSYSVAEDVGSVDITVSRTGSSSGAVSVDYAVTDGTATTAGSDYSVAAATGTLDWADGDAADKVITIAINDDATWEGDENLSIALSNASAGTSVSTSAAAVTISDNDGQAITGTVNAPGGVLAFNEPGMLDNLFAWFAGAANAGVAGSSGAADVQVSVYEVDNTGAVIAGPISTVTTDGTGSYTIQAPPTTPAPNYIVRAGAGGTTMDARIAAIDVTVDPVSDAASSLIAGNDLAMITIGEIQVVEDAVDSVARNVSTTGVSIDAISTALAEEANNTDSTANVISSVTTTGSICGNVSDGSAGLENITVVVRDYGNWVTRAKTRTDVNGDYCVNVPKDGDTDAFTGNMLTGEYIVGAINRTGTSMAASEWYTIGGGSVTQSTADKVYVADTTPIGIDFVLDPAGGRIQGTVTDRFGNFAEGVHITFRDYDTLFPVTGTNIKADGSYRINLPVGDYLIEYRNETLDVDASTATYNANVTTVTSAGFLHADPNRNKGTRVSVGPGSNDTLDVQLGDGTRLAGTIYTDAAMSAVITGERVEIVPMTSGGRLASMRANKLGKFRIWGPAEPYTVYTYGQTWTPDTTGGGNAYHDFAMDVARFTGRLLSADGVTGVAEAKIQVLAAATDTGTTAGTLTGIGPMVHRAISNSDGTFELVTSQTGLHAFNVRMDGATIYGSGTVIDGGGGSWVVDTGPASSSLLVDVTTLGGAAVNVGDVSMPTAGYGNGVLRIEGMVEEPSIGILFGVGATAFSAVGGRVANFTNSGDGSFKISMPAAQQYKVRVKHSAGDQSCSALSAAANGSVLTVSLTKDGLGAVTGCSIAITP